jgi:hypothetical protein
VLRIDDRDVIIADAGSSAGTSVNGVRITGPRRLRGGDRLQLGRVELTFSDDFDSASLPGARTMAWQHTPPPARRFDLHDQNAAVISNVAGNQYNEHALRIEPMRRRARTVMRTGFTLVFAGLAAYIVGGAVFASAILNFLKSVGQSQTPTPHVPVAGWAIAAIGSASIVVGIFVIIASLFMRRGVRRQEERL